MATWISMAVIIWVAVSVLVSLALGGAVRLADSRGAVAFGRSRVRRLDSSRKPRPVPAAAVAAVVAEPLRQVS